MNYWKTKNQRVGIPLGQKAGCLKEGIKRTMNRRQESCLAGWTPADARTWTCPGRLGPKPESHPGGGTSAASPAKLPLMTRTGAWFPASWLVDLGLPCPSPTGRWSPGGPAVLPRLPGPSQPVDQGDYENGNREPSWAI